MLLQKNIQFLDYGCGPGTISVGLAKAVEPGILHGIDMEASKIEMARAAAVTAKSKRRLKLICVPARNSMLSVRQRNLSVAAADLQARSRWDAAVET